MKRVNKTQGGKRSGSGRKPIGVDKMWGIRLSTKMSDAVLAWARKQKDDPQFSEAVRRLLAKALGL